MAQDSQVSRLLPPKTKKDAKKVFPGFSESIDDVIIIYTPEQSQDFPFWNSFALMIQFLVIVTLRCYLEFPSCIITAHLLIIRKRKAPLARNGSTCRPRNPRRQLNEIWPSYRCEMFLTRNGIIVLRLRPSPSTFKWGQSWSPQPSFLVPVSRRRTERRQ